MNNEGFTDHFSPSGGTDAFPGQGGSSAGATDAFGQSQDEYRHDHALGEDEVVDNRFVVQGPPIAAGGEAEIYRCIDQETQETVALKLYRIALQPKASILEKLRNVSHPNLIRVISFGVWQDKFYEVTEYCEGGTLADSQPLAESDLLPILSAIIGGLAHLHLQGIIHRDIKPENLYFRDRDRKDLVIADYGISSLLPDGKQVWKTGTYKSLTPSFAPLEFFIKNEVSFKYDYYSLGITLIHIFTGKSPFPDQDPRVIFAFLLQEHVPVPSHLSQHVQRLITGLIQHDPENRWGQKQIEQWSSGQQILADAGMPWEDKPPRDRGIPAYKACGARTLKELAALLGTFDAVGHLFDGYIDPWVNWFDSDLARKIRGIADNYGNRKELGLFRLTYLLDPALPLEINKRKFHTIEEIASLLQSKPDKSTRNALSDIIMGEFLECWIEVTQPVEGKQTLLRAVESIRTRFHDHPDKDLAIFALLYILAPQAPLTLRKDISISRPEEIEGAVSHHPDILIALRTLLFSGRFEEWLRGAFQDRQGDIAFIEHCRSAHKNDQDLGVWMLRWHFTPSLPFPFGKEHAAAPKDLARLIDKDEASTRKGISLMQKGWIRAWLETTGMLDGEKGKKFSAITSSGRNAQSQLESMLHFLDPGLPWPKPAASRQNIDFGEISYESSKTERFTIKNAGRGYLTGSIKLTGKGHGFAIDTSSIEEGPVTITVKANGHGFQTGTRQQTEIMVQTDGGTLTIPVHYLVSLPISRMISRSLICGAIGGLVFGTFRKLASLTASECASVIPSFTLDIAFQHPAIVILGFFFSLAVGGSLYYAIRMNIARSSNMKRHV